MCIRDSSYSTYLTRLYIQPNQNALRVGEITDDLSNRLRQLAHERWDSKYLIAARKRRVLHQIDNFNVILALQIFFANVLEVSEGGERSWSLAGNVKPQVPAIQPITCSLRRTTIAGRWSSRLLGGDLFHLAAPFR